MRLPHAGGNSVFLLAHDGEVDGGRVHAGMTKPALYEVERHAGTDRVDPEAVAQSLR